MLDFICWGCLLTIRSKHYCHRRIIFYRENPTGTWGEWYIAHWYHLKTPSSEGVVVDVPQIYMPGGHEITLVKGLLDEIFNQCANIYSRGAGSEGKCWKILSRLSIQLEDWEFKTTIAAKAGSQDGKSRARFSFWFWQFLFALSLVSCSSTRNYQVIIEGSDDTFKKRSMSQCLKKSYV